MRAVCQQCNAAQPPDWKAGDLCTACGAAVRRDVRCFWCAKWTPFAKFCRSCGAETLDETLYGAARMVKDAGTDRFTIPRMLREMDPDQRENFTRIYQRHAVLVERHVEEVRFLERFLFHREFSAALEEELTPQLPWNEETLKAFATPSLAPGNDFATASAIGASTPFPTTRSLSTLARLRLSDWGAFGEATHLLRSSDPQLRAEAALVLSGWRVRSSVGRLRDFEDTLFTELKRSPFRLEAAVRLAFLGGGDSGLLREALGSPDPEIAFPAALALGDVDHLKAALAGDDLKKSVAGSKLIELGIIQPVEQVIEKSPLEVQRELVESLLRLKGPVPEATTTLLEIVEKTEDGTLRERAARILCRELPPALTMRIARAARGERYIFQSLLSPHAALPPESLREFATWMVEEGHFRASQYGLLEAAERGAIPDGFVPAVFARADEETRRELLHAAERQFSARGDEGLHRFMMNVVFGPYPAKTRSAAWWGLHRTFRKDDPRGEGPFQLEEAHFIRFFGSTREFLARFTEVLRDDATLKEVGLYEFFARLFKESPPGLLATLVREEQAAHEFIRATLEAVQGPYWSYLLDGMIEFLGRVGVHPAWRDEVQAVLDGLGKKGNYYVDKALEALRLSVHGIPPEAEWSSLPESFVGDRFPEASLEGRRELLRVAEHQLIHVHPPPPSLTPALFQAAFGPYDRTLRIQALALVMERGDRRRSRLPLKPDPIGEVFGSLAGFLPRLAATLRDSPLLENRVFLSFLEELLKEADVPALREVEGTGDLVGALLEVAGTPGKDGQSTALRRSALRLLGELGGDPRWKGEIIAGLRKLGQDRGFDLGSECERALRLLDPPTPPPDSLRAAPPTTPVPSAGENPWIAKQKEAERLGRELQEKSLLISFGGGTPEEKTREILRLQEDFQARIKALYGM